MAETDGLYDTSEPALSNRIARFRQRITESPSGRAAQTLTNAIDDLNSAMHQAETPEQLAFVRTTAEAAIRSLLITISVVETFEQFR